MAATMRKCTRNRSSSAVKSLKPEMAAIRIRLSPREAANYFKKIVRSPVFQQIKEAAEKLAECPEELIKLADDAIQKAKQKKGPLGKAVVYVMASSRLIKAYAKGEYKAIPWRIVLEIITAVVYFVSPADVVPEGAVGPIGYVDDVVVVLGVIGCFKEDLDKFLAWEVAQQKK